MKTTILKQNQNLIRKSAWYYAKKFNMEFEELESQGYLIFCQALEKFDESKGAKFSTFLCHQLRALKDHCVSEIRHSHADMEYTEMVEAAPLSTREQFYEALDHLTEDSRQVLDCIFQGDFEQPEKAGKYGKRALENTLQEKHNMPYTRAVRTVCDLEKVYRIAPAYL